MASQSDGSSEQRLLGELPLKRLVRHAQISLEFDQQKDMAGVIANDDVGDHCLDLI